MAEVWKLRRQAEECRKAAERGRKKRNPNPYLLELAEHYDKQADEALARELAAAKPTVR
jgi:hypothetical protein